MSRKSGDDTARFESILPRVGDYSTWSEDELCNEIAGRRLAHGVGSSSQETAQRVKSHLCEILAGNDALSSELKKIAARYVGRLDACDKETKP